jgi:putative N6-adenine-specific DNA methylase
LFAVCTPGLEPFTAQELRDLGLLSSPADDNPTQVRRGSQTAADEEAGGVEFSGDLRAVYTANLWLRTASRVILRLGEFYAAAFSELRKKASRLDWERYLAPGQAVALRVTCHKSRLYHSDAVAERVAGAIADRLGRPPEVCKFDDQGGPALPQLIIVRLVHDRCTISLDTSGERLHRRGYRLATAKAPLRETLAAGMLLASGWDRASPLIDPFCGSGVVAIEAALMAAGKAPGLRYPAQAGQERHFAFMDWPGYDHSLWQALSEDALQRFRKESQKPAGPVHILASDRDAGAVAMAQANAARAGVGDRIEFSQRAVSAIDPPDGSSVPGWIVTNPPYGVRVSPGKDLRNLYAQFGHVLRARFPGWRVAILCSQLVLLHSTGIKLDASLALVNGGVKVKLGRGLV